MSGLVHQRIAELCHTGSIHRVRQQVQQHSLIDGGAYEVAMADLLPEAFAILVPAVDKITDDNAALDILDAATVDMQNLAMRREGRRCHSSHFAPQLRDHSDNGLRRKYGACARVIYAQDT